MAQTGVGLRVKCKEGAGRRLEWGTSCGKGDKRIHTNNLHPMDHNKCINRDDGDDTLRMFIYC